MNLKLGGEGLSTGVRWLAMTLLCAGVTSCGTTSVPKPKSTHGKEYFSEKEYGVKASPRVADGKNIPKGGGRYMVGKPYVVKGQVYVPKEDFGYNKVGVASWYGSAFHGRLTANGEVYDQMHLSAAHPTFPLPSYARVTNVETGTSIVVRVNDRGPYHPGRIIDLSNKTADMLDLMHSGTGKVRVQYVGKARMDGHDMPYLMASYSKKGDRFPSINPGGQIATGVMVASNQPMREQMNTLDSQRSSAIGIAGDTPSAPYRSTTPAAAALDAMVDFVALPDIGPMPYERPGWGGTRQLGSGYAAAAYAEAPTRTVYLSFDAVTPRNDGLTQGSILASYRRQASESRK